MKKENQQIILPNKDWLEKLEGSCRITTDGEITEIKPEDGKHFSLEEMYKHCNTDIIQMLWIPNNRIMIIDENGALKSNRKQNWVATKIIADYVEASGRCLEYFIYGDVIIVKEEEIE